MGWWLGSTLRSRVVIRLFISQQVALLCLISSDGVGPSDKYTHWKQVIFYFRDTITVSTGEEVRGTIEVAPNKQNERDLDIKIHVDFQGKHQTLHCDQEYILR